jgi:hypothetical protein
MNPNTLCQVRQTKLKNLHTEPGIIPVHRRVRQEITDSRPVWAVRQDPVSQNETKQKQKQNSLHTVWSHLHEILEKEQLQEINASQLPV